MFIGKTQRLTQESFWTPLASLLHFSAIPVVGDHRISLCSKLSFQFHLARTSAATRFGPSFLYVKNKGGANDISKVEDKEVVGPLFPMKIFLNARSYMNYSYRSYKNSPISTVIKQPSKKNTHSKQQEIPPHVTCALSNPYLEGDSTVWLK